MRKNIIIYENETDLNILDKTILDDKKYIKYDDTVHYLYEGKTINPPFFDHIIILNQNLEYYHL